MKKNTTNSLKGTLLKSCFLLLLALFSANLNAQITVDVSNRSLKEVFKVIESKSEYRFFYNEDLKGLDKVCSLKVTNSSIENTLSTLLSNTDITYKLEKKNLIILVAKVNPTQSDSKKVSGNVTDQNGEPLIGATVKVKGTDTGAITDAKGNFSLNTPDQSTVIISYIGYTPMEVKVGSQSNLKIRLTENSKSLDEVVVVAFGTQNRQTMTSSITQVKSKVLENRPLTNVLAGLQGQASGVNITQSSGQPGQSPSISIRGVGSLKSGTSPLTIIDGIPGSMSLISPNDVESVSILKDAAACSMYGARAANGVVLITTKKGKSGKMNVNYSGYVGTQKPTELFQEADAYNYASAYNLAKMYDVITPTNTVFNESKKVFTQAQLDDWKSGKVASTDWRKSLFSENGFSQSHSIIVTGGLSSDKVSIKNNLSFNYFQQKGNLVNTDYKRYGIRENGEVKWSKFTAGYTIGLSNALTAAPTSFIGDLGSIISAINRQRSVDPVKVYGDWNTVGTKDTRNPVRQALEGGKSNTNLYNALANVNLSYDIIPELTVKFTNGINFNDYSNNSFVNSLTWVTAHDANGKATATDVTGPNSDTRTTYKDIHYLQQLDLNYRKSIGKHSFAALLGGQQEYHSYDELYAKRMNFILNTSSSLQLGAADGATNSSTFYDWGLIGVFGRLNYDFNKRYLFELNFREDGSSRLTPGENNWGFSPSVSAGWRISEESFMAPVKSVISEMKLRASYGVLGNQDIYGDNNNQRYYSYQTIIAPDGSYYTFGSSLYNPMTLTQSPNNTFTWEKTAITDIAVDGNLWNGLISYSFGYFNKKTSDMLMMKRVSSVHGGGEYVANIGSMRNYGFEAELGVNKVFANGISVVANGNLTYMTNKILDLGGQDLVASGVYKNMVGHPLNAFYLYQSDGLLTKAEYTDTKTVLLKGQKWGDQKIKDVSGPNGTPDGIITADDKVISNKSTVPKWYFGFNFDVSYKGFGIAGMIQGAADYYKYLGGSVGYGFNSGYSITNWTIDNSYNPLVDENNYNTRLPRVSATNTINNNYPSDTYLFNCSYARLKNLQFYYNIPLSLTQKLKISNVKIFVSGQNLYTISALPKALGIDPEIGGATSSYPLVKIMTAGLNINF